MSASSRTRRCNSTTVAGTGMRWLRQRRLPALVASAALVAAGLTVTAMPASAGEERQALRDRTSMTATDDGVEVRWLAGGVVPDVAPLLLGRPPVTPSGGAVPAGPGTLAATPPSAGGAGGAQATDGLISNQGCLQHAASAVAPKGVSCIDSARMYASGRVHVHTLVPARIKVNVSEEPAIVGTGVGDVPPQWAGADSDDSVDRVYDFWTKPFETDYATTYYVSAKAWDSDGNQAWRYGTATTKSLVAKVTFEEIFITDDADKTGGSFLNEGEIEFFFAIDGDWGSALHLPKETLGIGAVDVPDGFGGSYVADGSLLHVAVQGVEHDDCGFDPFSLPPFEEGGGGDVGECYDYATLDLWVDLEDHTSGATVDAYVDDHYLEFLVTIRIETSLV